MKSILLFLFVSLATVFGVPPTRFDNIQLTGTPTEGVASSVTNLLQLDGTGIGEKVSPTTLWSAIVLTGTVDTVDVAGISVFARTYLDDTTSQATRFTLGLKEYFPEDYGAVAGDSNDDKAAIQAAIDACATAGGGVVKLSPGIYIVRPLGTGNGVLLRSGVRLQGSGAATRIRFGASTASANYTGVSPFAHDTTSVEYGANELDVRDIQLETDDPTINFTHSLIGINHCPRGLIQNVTLKDSYYHGIEVNRSRNIVITGCRFTGDFYSSQVQIDIGASGSISNTGAAGAAVTIQDLLIEKCVFEQRTTLTIVTPGRSNIELTHNFNQINRNITIRSNTFYNLVENNAGNALIKASVGTDNISYTLMENLNIEGNHFIGTNGTGNGMAVFLYFDTAAKLRGVNISRNTFDGSWYNLIQVSNFGSGSYIIGRPTATTGELCSGVVVEGNTGSLSIGAPPLTSGNSRGMRLILVDEVADARITNNTITLANTVEASWTSTASVGAFSYFLFANHVKSLVLENNRFDIQLTSVNFGFTGIQTASSGFEASGIPATQIVRGNLMTAVAGGSLLNAGYRYVSSVLRSAWANPPIVTGVWENNQSINAGSASNFHVNSVDVTMGTPDWRPGYTRMGEKAYFPSAPGGGWRALAGTAFASLTQSEKDVWQYQLVQGATALPTVTNGYIRLAGSETGNVIPQATLFLTATGALDFPSTAAGVSSDLTIALTGAVLGDCVILGTPNDSIIAAHGTYSAWVSATDTVTVRFSNNDLTTARDPASGTFRVALLKF